VALIAPKHFPLESKNDAPIQNTPITSSSLSMAYPRFRVALRSLAKVSNVVIVLLVRAVSSRPRAMRSKSCELNSARIALPAAETCGCSILPSWAWVHTATEKCTRSTKTGFPDSFKANLMVSPVALHRLCRIGLAICPIG
jgi:hypothetical protein